eukprot:NODE_3879_length_719_cov_45.050746_g3272_i0.p2 GENE.NODE_3879_length_719_cov_45.050746_g3272_i0~~NODE_3879_length_719_cov_45.050746_g3272_i0.p2  ORF type:complete len:167 (+),score=31.73 NODE_3879_length_719_cov_45.050746_g3272_i0:29-502(+)
MDEFAAIDTDDSGQISLEQLLEHTRAAVLKRLSTPPPSVVSRSRPTSSRLLLKSAQGSRHSSARIMRANSLTRPHLPPLAGEDPGGPSLADLLAMACATPLPPSPSPSAPVTSRGSVPGLGLPPPAHARPESSPLPLSPMPDPDPEPATGSPEATKA